MKVKELINELKKHDQNLDVVMEQGDDDHDFSIVTKVEMVTGLDDDDFEENYVALKF